VEKETDTDRRTVWLRGESSGGKSPTFAEAGTEFKSRL